MKTKIEYIQEDLAIIDSTINSQNKQVQYDEIRRIVSAWNENKQISNGLTEYRRYNNDKIFELNSDVKYVKVCDYNWVTDLNQLERNLNMYLETLQSKTRSVKGKQTVPSVNVYNNNYNSNSIAISINYEQVKQKIDDMTALSSQETDEIKARIDEIKAIIESKDNKKSKWSKLNNIIKWIADKSVDVGIALLPLLLQLG